jgi:hypothetical protein
VDQSCPPHWRGPCSGPACGSSHSLLCSCSYEHQAFCVLRNSDQQANIHLCACPNPASRPLQVHHRQAKVPACSCYTYQALLQVQEQVPGMSIAVPADGRRLR